MIDDDFIEFGETGLVPQKDGWFFNKKTGERIDPDGRVFDESGELVKDDE